MAMVYRIVWVGVALLVIAVSPLALAQADGDGSVTVTGALKLWHKVTLTIDGPFARETDTDPNPFTDYRLEVTFSHKRAYGPSFIVPGYFAADGNAGESSATEGNQWRVHFAPPWPGLWTYTVSFVKAKNIALLTPTEIQRLASSPAQVVGHGTQGRFSIDPSDKQGRDLRAHGRLEYVGEHYLRFAGSGDYFLKAGADAPETLLAYADFDGTIARKRNVPLKTYAPHLGDWREGDPTWQGGKGKGLIGAINYLSSTGCNAFSFLPYNAGGDGDNVWPFIERDDKLHYDCSKLDQWGVVFDHATARGMYLHFKLQETEMDDNVPTSLDGGELGPERSLYLRELIARFGHQLALNWNLGEENSQSTRQQRRMARYIKAIDPYDHHIVVHTFPNQQDKVYGPLLGDGSVLTGASLQNSNIRDCHWQVIKWVARSKHEDKPWVVAFDEPGDASFGQPPDPDYPGMDKIDNVPLTIDEVRKYALWGTLMAGGAGVEYYFGYKLPQNDLLCEDWRSRDQSWRYSAIALSFFRDHDIPFWQMTNRDDLIGADALTNEGYCFTKPGEVYLVYLPQRRENFEIDLSGAEGVFRVDWFNPRSGGELIARGQVTAGAKVTIPGLPDHAEGDDWLVVIRSK